MEGTFWINTITALSTVLALAGVSMATACVQPIDKGSVDVTQVLPRQLSTAIGDCMEIWANKTGSDDKRSYDELTTTIFDMKLITDRPLSTVGTSESARKDWQQLSDSINDIDKSAQTLGDLLKAAPKNRAQITKQADELADALMQLDDPRNIVNEK